MVLLKSPEQTTDKTYDYVVVGAGTAGLTLATRLTEDENIKVLVLEAGGFHKDDPNVDVPAQYAATFMQPKYDWAFKTVKQKYSNDNEHVWARGKGMGGSSNMNFFCWIKPPAQDIDAFEKLGNPGWNWADFYDYSLKTETWNPPLPEIAEKYPTPSMRSSVALPALFKSPSLCTLTTLDKIFQDTLEKKGVRKLEDPYGGDITGTWIAANNVDPKTWKRSYAATAYWEPNQDRPNLDVLLDAYAARVVWSDKKDSEGNLIAAGVEYVHGGENKTILAAKEVILAAGAIKSPQLLELSGVGRPEVLKKADVDVKLELPGVGENVQEHNFMWVAIRPLDAFWEEGIAADSMKQHAIGKGLHRTGITSFAFLPLSQRDPASATALIDELEKNLKESTDRERSPLPSGSNMTFSWPCSGTTASPDMEFIVFPGYFGARGPRNWRRFMTIIASLNHNPISRGYIHIKNNNPTEDPEIDANYFANNFGESSVLLESVKYIRSLKDTEPFASHGVQEVLPGQTCESDDDVENYIKNSHITTFLALCCPKKMGGVVDPNLKVYGTKNVRVVDLSIVPLHNRFPPCKVTTAYVIGEKAADIIRAAHKA
ncbi:GMC oxidoreductase [Coprinopsis sp. MPI-PUGE-AT-0042]|nr:GMC oxidoreductase [Coprinopsis sp. MPI-PUGE-AT-0042]